MSRRWKASLLIVLSLSLICVISYLFTPPPIEENHRANFEKIEKGMSRKQVEEIFGVPSGVYLTMQTNISHKIGPNGSPPSHQWVFNDGQAEFEFDGDDKIIAGLWVDNDYYLRQKGGLIRRLFGPPPPSGTVIAIH
jgi:hypothetical protein